MAFESLSEKLSAAFKRLRSKGRLTEADIKASMREIKLSLLEADVNYKVVKDFVAAVSEKCLGSDVLESLTPAQQVIKIVNNELIELMGGKENAKIRFASSGPTVVMMCGLQGAGKTTHCAKLAKYFLDNGKRPLLVGCDVYRPAAIDQLKVVGAKAGVPVFEEGAGDPVKIAAHALSHAKDHGNDLVILDTAGRLHIDEVLMDELRNIKSKVNPHEIILVLDAMTGQDAVNVASSFDSSLGIDSVILTKLDGDTRGGAALSVLSVTNKPVKFAGIGEKIGDIEPFHPDRMASRILGMGDMLTLIEKAEKDFDEKEALRLTKKLKENKFDLNDLLSQMQQIKKMGSVKDLIKMVPGMGKIDENAVDERGIYITEAIILSMTKKEREKPSIINPSRKKRIASGSGTTVTDVNRLLKQYEQMSKMFKQMNGKKGLKGRFNPSMFGM